jgi:hypothetical protein
MSDSNYRYAIENRWRMIGPVTDATAEDVAALSLAGEWQGAEDLPTDTEFVDAKDVEGREVRVYRTAL